MWGCGIRCHRQIFVRPAYWKVFVGLSYFIGRYLLDLPSGRYYNLRPSAFNLMMSLEDIWVCCKLVAY